MNFSLLSQVFSFLALAAAPATSPAPAGSPCALLTGAEVGSIQEARVSQTHETRRKTGRLEIGQCFYVADPYASSVSLELTRSGPNSPRSARRRWEHVFHDTGRPDGDSDADEEEPRARPVPVARLGEEAFWIGSRASGALYVLKDDAILRISVGGTGTDSAKRERAEKLARSAVERF